MHDLLIQKHPLGHNILFGKYTNKETGLLTTFRFVSLLLNIDYISPSDFTISYYWFNWFRYYPVKITGNY